MIKLSAVFLSLILTSFAFASFPVTQDHADLGDQQILTLKIGEIDEVFHLTGEAVKVGQLMPSVELTDSNLDTFNTGKSNGNARIYVVLTSVDTPVCEQQLNDLAAFIKESSEDHSDIEFIVVSADTPFAQRDFIADHELEDSHITFLSDSLAHDFGDKTGTQIKEFGLLARTIIVVDKNNKISHIQRVPELTTIPDIKEAIKKAKATK